MDLTVAKRITNSLVKLRPKSDMYHLVNGKFTPLSDHGNGSTSSQTVIESSNGKKNKGKDSSMAMATAKSTTTTTTTVTSKNGASGGYLSKLTKSISHDAIGNKNKRSSVTPKKTAKSEDTTNDELQSNQVKNNCVTVSGTVDTIDGVNGSNITACGKSHSKLKSTKSFGTYSVLQDALAFNGSSISGALEEVTSGHFDGNNSAKNNGHHNNGHHQEHNKHQSNIDTSNGKVLNLTKNEVKLRIQKNDQNSSARQKLLRHSAIDPGSNKQYSFGQMEAYIRLDPLGEGSYATVYKGFSNLMKKVVALKEIRLEAEEGAPFTAIREASLLRCLRHANIVTLHDIIHTKDSLTYVFEFVDTDLSRYLEKHPGGLNGDNVRIFMFQLLRGLSFCHKRQILHRDLKPQNLLISLSGELKLADFGLARAKSVPSSTYSHEVVTLWYRPPDVLLGSNEYTTSLDIWGVGCIFIEMISGSPAFPGAKDVLDQLDKIWRALGTPSSKYFERIPKISSNINIDSFINYPKRELSKSFPKLKKIKFAHELAESFLQLNPRERITAEDALQHAFFSPLPSALYDLPPTASIFTVKGISLKAEASTVKLTTSPLKSLASGNRSFDPSTLAAAMANK